MIEVGGIKASHHARKLQFIESVCALRARKCSPQKVDQDKKKIRRALHHTISIKSHFKHKALDRPKFAITMEVETKNIVLSILNRWKSALGTPIADERRYMDLVTGL